MWEEEKVAWYLPIHYVAWVHTRLRTQTTSRPAYPAMVRLLFSLSSSWESRVSVSWVAMATTRDPLRPSCSNFAFGDTSSRSSTLVNEVDTITEFKSMCSSREYKGRSS